VPSHEGQLDTFITSGMAREAVDAIPHLPQGKGLLGAIFHERKSIRIPRISGDSRSVGFPANHPPMEPFLGVPVVVGNEVLGNLYFTNKLDGDEFTDNDQYVVELLAAHAGIAIQNARLYEQVGRLAIVEERNRIGMDLHDGVIQSIFAVGLTLESTKLAFQHSQEEADQLLEHAITGLNDTIRDIRNYILDLRPHRFRGDLESGLGRLVREFQANTMVPVQVQGQLDFTAELPPDMARAIFLTTQEALANIARHAKADSVVIAIDVQDGRFIMNIRDDGQGFNLRDRNYSIGHGLSNMRTRAEDLNGVYKIASQPGEGTVITLELPLA
jgi:two-component system sensor histidine kinase DevS